jgi:hypothetical protein
MDKTKEYNLHEAIADIAMSVGYYLALGKIKESSINDSRNFVGKIIVWAKEFESTYNPDNDEDYISAIDKFTESKLLQIE